MKTMKANVKGLKSLVIVLLVPFVLGQCTDRSEEVVVVEQTNMPQVFEAVAVKVEPTQERVQFYLTSEYLDAEWKVYPSATEKRQAAGLTATCDNGAMLVLTHITDIRPSTYYVSATVPGKTESERMPLTVLAQVETETPVTSIPTVAKSGNTQTNVSFTLDNAEVYSSLSKWKLYMLEGGTGLVPAVTARLSGEILTLTHNTDVPERTYWVAVADEGKSESKRMELTVIHYDPKQTPAPQPENATVTKTSTEQANVAFPMRNAYNDPQWTLYASAAGGVPITNVLVSFSGNTLTLSHTPDVPDGAYFLTATDEGLLESAPVKLTVNKYTAPPTATPTADMTNFAKTALEQSSAVFALTNMPPYSVATSWQVYVAETGPTPAINISPTYNNNTLTLMHTSNILPGEYWVAATEDNKTESGRLRLTVTAYEQDKTPTPTVASAGIVKTAGMQPTVAFTLTNTPNYASSPTTTWKVYSTAMGPAVVSGVTASSANAVLTLKHETDIPERTYYVAATQPGKAESDRLVLTVAKDRTSKPSVASAVVAKTALTQSSVNFTLVNDDPAEFPSNTEWRLYGEADAGSPLIEISVTPDRTGGGTGSGTLLVLTKTPNITARDFWLAALVPGKIESERVQITVIDYDPGRTPTPTTTPANAHVAKTALKQINVVFTLSNAPNYRPNTVWKVYTDATGNTRAANMSASHSGVLLTLTSTLDDVLVKTYYVSATEGDLTESLRIPLTVGLPSSTPPPPIGQTPTPIVSVPSLDKTSLLQTSINFTLDNASAYSPTTCTWTVYAAATGNSPSPVSATLLYGSILRLSYTSDIPAQDYWVTASEPGKTESARLKLTVVAYIPGSTPTPVFASPLQKPPTAVPSMNFPLLNATDYSGSTEWTVYSTATGTAVDNNVTVTLSNASLILTSITNDVAAKDYWITAHNAPTRTESARRKLTIDAAPQTPTPVLLSTTFTRLPDPPVPSVTTQVLNYNPPYSSNSIWNIYDVEWDGAPITYLIPTFNPTTGELLMTSNKGDVPSLNYWITAQEPLKSESARQKFTVTTSLTPPPPPPPPPPLQTKTPVIQYTVFGTAWPSKGPSATDLYAKGNTKEGPGAVTVAGAVNTVAGAVNIIGPILKVKLLNSPPYSNNCLWNIYDASGNNLAFSTASLTYYPASQELVLADVNNIQLKAQDYYITAQEPLEDESEKLRIDVVRKYLASNRFNSYVGDHILTITLPTSILVDTMLHNDPSISGDPYLTARGNDAGIFAPQSSLSLSHFILDSPGKPGYTHLTGGKVKRVDDHTVVISGLPSVLSENADNDRQRLLIDADAFNTIYPNFEIEVKSGGGNGRPTFVTTGTGNDLPLYSHTGNRTVTFIAQYKHDYDPLPGGGSRPRNPLDGGATFVPQEYLNLSQFSLTPHGTTGFTSLNGGTITRVNDHTVTISGLPELATSGKAGFSVAASAFATIFPKSREGIHVLAHANGLPSLQVFAMEQKEVVYEGFVEVDGPTPIPPQWFVRGAKYAALTGVNSSPFSWVEPDPTLNRQFMIQGYPSITFYITGLHDGNTTYYGRLLRDGELIEDEGPLKVIARTTWYVEPGATGKYGFTLADKVSLTTCRARMQSFYRGDGAVVWPQKGYTDEWHGIIRLFANESAAMTFDISNDDPKYIDLVNNEVAGTLTVGDVIVGNNKHLTLDGVNPLSLQVNQGATATIKGLRTNVDGNIIVAGEVTVENGTLRGNSLHVRQTGKVTVNAGSLTGYMEVSGEVIMNGGNFNSVRMDVNSNMGTTGGRLTIYWGTNVNAASRIYLNGTDVTPANWASVSYPYVVAAP
ncbi:hypothetical protein AGMMS49965_04800 [Bacteroidia bacterium]|nr:hypothetical protein AGMMS49965_04800 [Bacteroidia bacterium]